MPFPFPHLHGAPVAVGPPPPPPPGPNFNITPSTIDMSRSGAGNVSTPVSVTDLVLDTGPGHTVAWSTSDPGHSHTVPNNTDDINFDVDLLDGESRSGILFVRVVDTGNGGFSNGAVGWTATSNP